MEEDPRITTLDEQACSRAQDAIKEIEVTLKKLIKEKGYTHTETGVAMIQILCSSLIACGVNEETACKVFVENYRIVKEITEKYKLEPVPLCES